MPRTHLKPAACRLAKRIARAIRAAREAQGLSQPAAAAALGVTVWTYRPWEYGTRTPPASIRARIVAEWGGDPKALRPESKVCPRCGQWEPGELA